MFRLTMLAALLLGALCASGASALELVMVRSAGCPWCAAWDREVAPVYPKTEIGQRLPIRSIDHTRTADLKAALKSPVRFTPTFVLIDQEHEIGRIEGYPGQEFFWGLLENLVRKPLTDRDAARGGG
jgi:thioredoxin-related protein